MQPFYGFRNSQKLFLPVRALRGREPNFDRRTTFGSFRTMLSQYASHEIEGLELELEFETGAGDTLRQGAVTDKEGFASFELAYPDGYDLPLNSGWEKARLRWGPHRDGIEGGETIAFILAPGRSAGIGVISDIDDTILETGITGNIRAILRNWKRIMVEMPGDRVMVPGASDFYAELGGPPAASAENREGTPHVPQARPRPVFYVSSSPWNLFSYLVTFKREREMPLGPVMLRDWGFNRRTLGSEGHGSHKEEAIRRIIATYPELRFAMVGDDTQKDLVAFGKIVREQPGRVAAVFIRRVADAPFTAAEEEARAAIGEANVPFWMGSDYRAASDFLKDAGLKLDHSLETLVEIASEGVHE